MGWTTHGARLYKANGDVDRKAEMDNIIKKYSKGKIILKSTMVGNIYYAAIRHNDNSVYAMVVITSVKKDEFTYKSLSEFEGPLYYTCPLSILKLLTPTDDEYANKWREACYKYHAEKKALKNNPKAFANLPIGTKIIWTIPEDGWNIGKKGDKITLVKVKSTHKQAFWYDGHGSYKVTPNKISCDDYEIVA